MLERGRGAGVGSAAAGARGPAAALASAARGAAALAATRSAAAALALAALLAGCGDGGPASRPLAVQVLVPDGLAAEDATGFVLRPGRVVTVAHVLDARGVRVRVRVGQGPSRPARIVSIDERDDLALLAVPGLRADRARLGGTAATGILVLRGGRARVVPARVRRSILARIRTPDGRRIVRRPALDLEAAVLPGDSGAPVLSADGRVTGVVFARSNLLTRTAYAVDARALRRLGN
jgi:S1-C subfamily serine protease